MKRYVDLTISMLSLVWYKANKKVKTGRMSVLQQFPKWKELTYLSAKKI